jgi:cytochrome c oxidase subunit 2
VAIGATALFVALAVAGWVTYANAQSADASLNGATTDVKTTPFADATLKSPVSLKAPEGQVLNVQVNGQQYLWRYTYLGALSGGVSAYSYHDLVVPVGVTVMLNFTSSDVVHSWWVPQLGGSYDAVPGYVNRGWIRVDKPGVYRGYATSPSGPNYPSMTTTVRALSPEDFSAWLDQKKSELSEAYDALAQARESGEQERQISGQEAGTTAPAPGADDTTGAADSNQTQKSVK